MINSIQPFRNNLQYVKNLDGLYVALSSQTYPVLDLSDILRSELVLAVSSLDHFIHVTTEEGILEMYQGVRPSTPAFEEFHVIMSNVKYAINNPSDVSWLRDQIRKNLGYKSYQKSESISAVLKLISSKRIWDEVETIMGSAKSQITLELDLIIDRRNKIAHEADLDPTYPNKRWPINRSMVNDAVSHIEKICEAIFQVVK